VVFGGFKARFRLLFFGIGTGTHQDFCHVDMRTTVLDGKIAPAYTVP